MATKLRLDGHKVYDFTDRECRKTPEFPHDKRPESFDAKKHKSYRLHLESAPQLYAAVMNNQEAIRWCDLVILLLPCGNEAHADWGYGVGLGKASIITGHPREGDYSATHLWADKIIDDPEDVYAFIRENY